MYFSSRSAGAVTGLPQLHRHNFVFGDWPQMIIYLQVAGVKGRVRLQARHRGRGGLGVQAGQVEMRHHGSQTLLLLVQLLEEVKRRGGGGGGSTV